MIAIWSDPRPVLGIVASCLCIIRGRNRSSRFGRFQAQSSARSCEHVPANIGVSTTQSLTLVADFDLRIILPVVEISYPGSSAFRRLAILLASDGNPVARDLAHAMDWLRNGCIPTRAEAYHAARIARKPLDFPLRYLKQGDCLQAICEAVASQQCRGVGSLGVCRARQVIQQGRGFLDDGGVLRWICGSCAQGKGLLPWKGFRDGSESARDPFGLEWGHSKGPRVMVTLTPRPSHSSRTSAIPKADVIPPVRRKGQARWDEEAFSRPWFFNLAYAMGVIAGDGAIRSDRIVVELAAQDRDILEAVCSALGADPTRICEVRRKAQKVPTMKIALSSPVAPAQLLDRLGLAKFGPKHEVLVIPPDLPDGVLGDFVRGFLDADGSVHQCKDRSPMIQLHSNSRALLDQLRARIAPLVGSPLLGALHRPSGTDAKGRPRKGWALAITGYEAQDVARWLWPSNRRWVGGSRKYNLARHLILGWKPRRARKAKRRNLGFVEPTDALN